MDKQCAMFLYCYIKYCVLCITTKWLIRLGTWLLCMLVVAHEEVKL